MNTETLHTKTKKQLVPQLRFVGFDDEWNEIRLTQITSKIGSGKTPKGGSEVYQDEGIPFIRSQNVINGALELDSTHISEKINSEMKSSMVEPNDILLNITGASIGRTCVVPTNFERGNVNQHVCIVRLKNNYSSKFLQSFLSSFKGQKLVLQGQTGSGREGLNFHSIGLFNVAFPTLPEQQKIASFLSVVDSKLQLLTQKKELLEQYKKGVMQQLFSKQLRFKQEDGSDYPDWEEKKIGDVLFERDIKKPKSEEYPLMAFMANKGVAPKGDRYNREFLVNDGNNKKYKQTEYGDFIYSSNNLETGSIGLNRYGNASISPVYSIFKIGESCEIEFMSNYLVRKEFINKMIRFRQGVIYGQWRIHESEFLKIVDKIPSKEEQQQIANYLAGLDTKIESVAQQITQIQQFKKGLLQQMFV